MQNDKIDTIKDDEIEFSLLQNLPLSFVKGNVLLPLRSQDGELIAAVSGNPGLLALRDLARSLRLKPHPVLAEEKIIIDAINRIYSQTSRVNEVMGDIKGEDLSMIATEFESPKDLL